MGADIFGYDRKAQPGAVFSTEASIITIADAGQVFLGQQLELTYAQKVDDIFEIGSSDIYWIGGRPSGSGSLGRLIAPTKSLKAAQDAMQFCKGGATMDVAMGQTCEGQGGTPLTVECSGVVLVGKKYSLSTENIAIVEGLSFKIAKLEENNQA